MGFFIFCDPLFYFGMLTYLGSTIFSACLVLHLRGKIDCRSINLILTCLMFYSRINVALIMDLNLNLGVVVFVSKPMKHSHRQETTTLTR